ncbi:TolB family protein [Bacteroidota bacterium]
MKKLLVLMYILTIPIVLFSQIKQITNDDNQDYHPKWATNNDFILFTSRDLSNQPGLKLFDIKNDSIINVVTGKKGDHYSNWIPNTHKILFDSYNEQGRGSIWELDLESMQIKEIIGDQVCFHPCPSHDGRKIVFTSYKTGNSDIFIFDLDTGKTVQVTFNQKTDHHPIWSHDQEKIIFESNRSGNFDIYEYNINEKKIKPLIETPEFDCHTCLSPNGEYVAYSHGPTGKRNIIIRNISTGQEYSITKEYDNSWPDWSTNNLIVFVSNREENMNLYTIDISDLLKRL